MKACYPGADVDRLTKHIWRMYDTNNDGAIDFRQKCFDEQFYFIHTFFELLATFLFFLKWLHVSCCKILSSVVRELMLVLYVMSDGTAEQNLKQIFRIFDLNNDGKINQEEMDKITKDLSKLFKEDRETLATGIFKEMDTNNDGEISEEEFIQACLSQKKMSKKLTLKIIDLFVQ